LTVLYARLFQFVSGCGQLSRQVCIQYSLVFQQFVELGCLAAQQIVLLPFQLGNFPELDQLG
jgi:hypothetical protein